jgi:hopanoid biosynthesis associated protein HpnK
MDVETRDLADSRSLPQAERALIVTGDDFGRSSAVNHAIFRAHRDGILTSTSLMVNEPAFQEAVDLARSTPTLAVGLHLALSGSRPTLPPGQIQSLLRADGCFSESPARAGWRYFYSGAARQQLEREIRAQIERFLSTGLPADHVDGHHHLHMHPVIFPILARACQEYGIRAVRIVRENLGLSLRVDPGRLVPRISLSSVFWLLSGTCLRMAQDLSLRTADQVLGLHLDGRMTRDRLLRLIELLPPGTTEIYSHPSLVAGPGMSPSQVLEFQALIAPELRGAIGQHGIRLRCYRDVERGPHLAGSPHPASPPRDGSP